MDNLTLYNKFRVVPGSAKKPITAGRLKNMTDINPMYRIKVLTEQFGACGIGWKYEIVSERLEQGANDEICAFVRINLYFKQDGEWSAAIPGTGGASFVAKERNGLYTSDECFKMALTDAISVACKALGVGADVYWEKDRTKYDVDGELVCEKCGKAFVAAVGKDGNMYPAAQWYAATKAKYGMACCVECIKEVNSNA